MDQAKSMGGWSLVDVTLGVSSEQTLAIYVDASTKTLCDRDVL